MDHNILRNPGTEEGRTPLPPRPGVAPRVFATGASRDTDTGKLDYEGFFSPLVMKAFAEYMHKNRTLVDGTVRDSDNWQRGMPLSVYMKSAYRHFMSWWGHHRAGQSSQAAEDLCGLLFNAQGYLHTLLGTPAVSNTQAPPQPDTGKLPQLIADLERCRDMLRDPPSTAAPPRSMVDGGELEGLRAFLGGTEPGNIIRVAAGAPPFQYIPTPPPAPDPHRPRFMWYLATPYAAFPPGPEKAHRLAVDVLAALMRRGFCVFSPIAHNHAAGRDMGRDHDYWMSVDRPFMERCNGMLWLSAPGAASSRGMAYERAYFEAQGRPVYVLSDRPEADYIEAAMRHIERNAGFN
jgi:nucleoside 2-deoxyribosyltransferase